MNANLFLDPPAFLEDDVNGHDEADPPNGHDEARKIILHSLKNLPGSSILAHVYGHQLYWPGLLNAELAIKIVQVLMNHPHYCSECPLELINWMAAQGVPPSIDMLKKILEFRIANIDVIVVVEYFLENLGHLVPPAYLDIMWHSILDKACGVSVRTTELIGVLVRWRRGWDLVSIELDYLHCLTQAVINGNPNLTTKLLEFFEGRHEVLPFKPFDCVFKELVSGFWVHWKESMDCMRALSVALPLTRNCAELMRAEYQRIKVLNAGRAAGFNANKLEMEMEEVMATWQ